MARQNYSHTADIVKATLPYFDPGTRPKVEFMSKLLDLMGSLNIFGRESMVACGKNSINIDIEGLLNGIRPLCDSKEREFVDRILNIFNMKRTFEMYNNVMNVMNTMQGFSGSPFGSNDNKDDTDTVTGNFTSPNFESIFQAFSGGLNHPPEDETKEADPPDPPPVENQKNDFTPNDTQKSDFTPNDTQKGGFAPNDTMFDMLRGMVPAEQQSTFENLRMLFNTMSYDNNRKPDDSKEHNDG